ncbi:2308_t:CDS:2 [Entrophospora sp. SA101]|nr:2308_t:CDS:2 [Entrophospora sp. SA101]
MPPYITSRKFVNNILIFKRMLNFEEILFQVYPNNFSSVDDDDSYINFNFDVSSNKIDCN